MPTFPSASGMPLMDDSGPDVPSLSTPADTSHAQSHDHRNGVSDNIGELSEPDHIDMSYFADTSADYSTHLSEVLSDDQEQEHLLEDGEEEFGDHWKDVPSPEPGTGNYAERMRVAMGLDDSEKEADIVEGMLDEDDLPSAMDEVLPDNVVRKGVDITAPPIVAPAPLISPPSPSDTTSLMVLPSETATPSKQRPAFLHPSVSRLRSHQPVHHRLVSSSSMNSMDTLLSLPNGASPALSHFSDVSRASTPTRLDDVSHEKSSVTSSQVPNPRQPFRWNILHALSTRIYPPSSSKPSAVLGLSTSLPTAIVANGLLCVGKTDGMTHVFDFRQHLRCTCGNETSGKEAGAVTALALSHDHTFLAVGHAQGHIYLYDLARHQVPARTVPPTTMSAVASGKKEGHLAGSSITHLSFIGARHTALVSADKSGLAFYHSLGKVLFIEASDVLRILGRYPDEIHATAARHTSGATTPVIRSRSTILSMSALPLGPAAHPTEAYNLIAILTPVKLIVVGLRPSPRTWFRHHRDVDSSEKNPSLYAGCLAWFPSFADSKHTEGRTLQERPQASSRPVLAYSWGNTVILMRVNEERLSRSKTATKDERKVDEIGKVTFEQVGNWSADGDIVAIIWLNQMQLLVFTSEGVDVIDVQKMISIERTAIPSEYVIANRWAPDPQAAISTPSHCIRAYKGKLFLLGAKAVRAGSLLTWTDHILMFIKQGDFLSAIDLCRSYLTGEATGNKAGLPEDADTLRQVVGQKMSELMVASASFAFSEDRMHDSTHDAPDGRGVDRTWLFEKMVSTCAEACLTLGDNDFLFNDLYERYQDMGIDGIYLAQLEPFVLDGRIRTIPPHISQRLIAVHEENEQYGRAEALIWHIDPLSLDINQAIHLCRDQQLCDALVYVYTNCLKDYVTPIVDLLLLIHEIRLLQAGGTYQFNVSHMDLETMMTHAYKVYAYLGDVLTGVEYPSNGQMDEDDATNAKRMVYAFLFFGRTSPGESGHLVVTVDDDGLEISYPYLRMLLSFDAEAFLHTLDLAFEDSYLNDDGQGVNRQLIINVLLDIAHLHDLQPEDATFVRIFIARNAPKYPQFVRVTPSTYDRLLLELASDPDVGTREDRQLASEYLLSAYTPHDGDRLVDVFERAGFYRILRSIYSQERKWLSLLSTYLRDEDLPREELFASLDKTIIRTAKACNGVLPDELRQMILESIPRLLHSSIYETAVLVDNHLQSDHARVLEAMPPRSYQQFAYLRYLLEPNLLEGIDDDHIPRKRRLEHVDSTARHLYVELLCEYDAGGIIRAINALPSGFLNLQEIIQTCNERGLYDIEIWSLNREGRPSKALDRLEVVMAQQANALADLAESGPEELENGIQVDKYVSQLRATTAMGLRICQERGQHPSTAGLHIEEMWFRLLYSEVNIVQLVSTAISPKAASIGNIPEENHSSLLESLRALVQETLVKLISTPTSRSTSLSFPALFARLVDSVSATHHASTYSEFRTILTGMLSHYRSEADTLGIVGQLVGQDLFSAVEEKTRYRRRGWPAKAGNCDFCGRPLHPPEPKTRAGTMQASIANGHANGAAAPVDEPGRGPDDVVIGLGGLVYHKRCFEVLRRNTPH